MQVYGIFTVASLWTYQEINHAFGQVILIVIKYNAHTHTQYTHARSHTVGQGLWNSDENSLQRGRAADGAAESLLEHSCGLTPRAASTLHPCMS